MDGDIYIEPTSRQVDSSDRTDADGGGGGTSFVFIGGDGAVDKEEEEKKKVKKPVDFGKPVELELSSAVTGRDDDEEEDDSAYYAEDEADDEEYDDDEDSDVILDIENHPDSSPGHHPGTKINFTI